MVKVYTIILLMFSFLALLAQGDNEFILHGENGMPFDEFGTSVDIHGDFAIVGAPAANDTIGQVYIFQFVDGEWLEQDVLEPADAEGETRFGYAVAIQGELIAVGAYMDSEFGSGAGAVYLYRYDGISNWEQIAKLSEDDGIEDGDRFGYSVALDGNYLAVGAYFSDNIFLNSGSVYLYHFEDDEWTLEQRLVSPAPNLSGQYGNAIDINGDMLIVGARGEDPDGRLNAGAAYLYQRSELGEWMEVTKFEDLDSAALGDHFGYDVAIWKELIVVGQYQADTQNAGNAGKAHIYRLNMESGNWDRQQVLEASDDDSGDEFGYAVAIDSNVAVIGAHFDDQAAEESGAAYVYTVDESGNWLFDKKIIASDADGGSRFGAAVSVYEERVIIGSPFAFCEENRSGAAYIYMEVLTGIEDGGAELPTEFSLSQNYPNPFNPTTNFGFRISDFGLVTIKVFNVQGQLIRTLLNEPLSAGSYEATWDGMDEKGHAVASGLYFYQLTVHSNSHSAIRTPQVMTQKMILAR